MIRNVGVFVCSVFFYVVYSVYVSMLAQPQPVANMQPMYVCLNFILLFNGACSCMNAMVTALPQFLSSKARCWAPLSKITSTSHS